MRYDIRLRLCYRYHYPVADARHLAWVAPRSLPGVQTVQSLRVGVVPMPAECSDFEDFFGNRVTAFALRQSHETLEVDMHARVDVVRGAPGPDRSPDLAGLRAELSAQRTLVPESPWHFLSASARIPPLPRIIDYAARSGRRQQTVLGILQDLGKRLHKDFSYDAEATEVDTPIGKAFDMRAGVCQDFSHIMIAGLRGLGIPAGYVSGFLRTLPPPGKPRLEGADATHAWVRVWCGEAMGWYEFDPTNGIAAGEDHIVMAYGRDYDDVPPIAGVLKTLGEQKSTQLVDVIALD